jgi:hypothetical protein
MMVPFFFVVLTSSSIFDQQPYLLCPHAEADVCLDKLLTRKSSISNAMHFLSRPGKIWPALKSHQRAENPENVGNKFFRK